MGINPPSLYAAFGSKEGLFRAVLDRYEQERKDDLDTILAAPTARDTAELFFLKVAEGATSDGKHPPGCLLVQSGQGCGEEAIPEMAARLRSAKEMALRDRFSRARKEGDSPQSADPAALARYLMAVANGMFMQASAWRDDQRSSRGSEDGDIGLAGGREEGESTKVHVRACVCKLKRGHLVSAPFSRGAASSPRSEIGACLKE